MGENNLCPETKGGKPMKHSCIGCKNTWTGLTRCHCCSCHETFESINLFDRHRTNGACKKPGNVDMTWKDGIWIQS